MEDRAGRRQTVTPRNEAIFVRVTTEEWNRVFEWARQRELSMSTAARHLMLAGLERQAIDA